MPLPFGLFGKLFGLYFFFLNSYPPSQAYSRLAMWITVRVVRVVRVDSLFIYILLFIHSSNYPVYKQPEQPEQPEHLSTFPVGSRAHPVDNCSGCVFPSRTQPEQPERHGEGAHAVDAAHAPVRRINGPLTASVIGPHRLFVRNHLNSFNRSLMPNVVRLYTSFRTFLLGCSHP